MANEHGIYVTESPTSVPQSTAATNGVPVVFGLAPVNMAADPAASVNTPILATSYDEAVEKLGYSENFKAYTICASIYAHFKKQSVGPVVFVNVLDPSVHKKALAEQEYTVVAKQVKIEQEGILNDESLVVKNDTATLVKGEDYTVSYNTSGYLVITVIDGGDAANAAALKVSGNQLDPSLVDEDDIIGGYEALTSKRTGLEALADVYPVTGMVPGLILAPGWSKKKNVGTMMQLKCENINDMFRANCLLDLDTTTCKTYESVKTTKDSNGYNDSDAIVLWPMAQTADHDGPIPYSAIYAATVQACDIDHDSVPARSPSNRRITYITGACLEDGTEVKLERSEANVVEDAGVVTLLRWNGDFRSWGDYTAAWPEEEDPKEYWINVRRMFSWQANNFILLYIESVDENISYRLIESIVDSENIRLSAYVPEYLAAASIEFRAEDNPDAQIIAGKIKFKQYISPYVPAKVIENDLEYDVSAIRTALFGTGGEE